MGISTGLDEPAGAYLITKIAANVISLATFAKLNRAFTLEYFVLHTFRVATAFVNYTSEITSEITPREVKNPALFRSSFLQ